MKIKKADLKQLEKDGVTVKRAMGKQPARPPAKIAAETNKTTAKPTAKAVKKPAKHAAMKASMDSTSTQLEAANKLLAMNGEMLREFKDSLADLKPREPVPYTFDIKRDGEGLLKRVYARPGIDGDDDDVQRH